MPFDPYVLLDTMVVAGLYTIAKTKDTYATINRAEWNRAIQSLLSTADIINYQLKIPTPVCYELMMWKKGWYDYITTSKEPIFNFSTWPIANKILCAAAKFSYETHYMIEDGKECKPKGLDPIIAAYSILFGYFIITENLQDFPDSHFDILALEPVILEGQKGRFRKIIGLLKPKK